MRSKYSSFYWFIGCKKVKVEDALLSKDKCYASTHIYKWEKSIVHSKHEKYYNLLAIYIIKKPKVN